MNERINNLRLDAGIAQLKDDLRLVVIDREGNVIDPLIGLEKFAELIVRECISRIEGCAVETSPDDFVKGYNKGVSKVSSQVKQYFGVEEK